MAYYTYGQTNATTYGERAYTIIDVATTATKYTFTIKFGIQAISRAIPAGYKATGQLTGNVTWKTYSKTTTAIAKNGYFQIGSVTVERERDRDNTKTFTINWDGMVIVPGSGDEYVVSAIATRTFNIEKLPRYTVSYNGNGGSGVPSNQTKIHGESLTLSSTKPTQTGYNFLRWNTNNSGTGTNYNSGGTYTGNANLALYAIWSKITYTVSYNANGGSGAPANQTKTYGVALTLSSTKPTRTGYDFIKWNTNSSGTGTNYNSGANYTSNANLSLYAVWSKKTYTVSYNANGGSGAPSSQTKTYDVNLTLTSTKPTRTGYDFVKWNTKADGTGTNYNSGASYTSNAAVTLYAVWTQSEYTISYNANGGSGAPSQQTKDYNETITISSVKPTRADYIFIKWNTKADGSGINYDSGDNYSANADIILYAVWQTTYTSPVINNIKAYRVDTNGITDDDGLYAKVEFVWTEGMDSSTNPSVSVGLSQGIIKWKKTTESTYTNQKIIDSETLNSTVDVENNSHTVIVTIGSDSLLQNDYQYDIIVILTPEGANSRPTISRSTYVSIASFIIDINKDGNAIGIGMRAPDNIIGNSQLHIGSDVYFNQNNKIHFPIQTLSTTKHACTKVGTAYEYTTISELSNWNIIAVHFTVHEASQVVIFIRGIPHETSLIDVLSVGRFRATIAVEWENNRIAMRCIAAGSNNSYYNFVYFQNVYGIC